MRPMDVRPKHKVVDASALEHCKLEVGSATGPGRDSVKRRAPCARLAGGVMMMMIMLLSLTLWFGACRLERPLLHASGTQESPAAIPHGSGDILASLESKGLVLSTSPYKEDAYDRYHPVSVISTTLTTTTAEEWSTIDPVQDMRAGAINFTPACDTSRPGLDRTTTNKAIFHFGEGLDEELTEVLDTNSASANGTEGSHYSIIKVFVYLDERTNKYVDVNFIARIDWACLDSTRARRPRAIDMTSILDRLDLTCRESTADPNRRRFPSSGWYRRAFYNYGCVDYSIVHHL